MNKATHHGHSHVQSLWLEKSDINHPFQKESQKFKAVTTFSFREWERVTRTGWIIWFEKNLLGVPKCSWYKSKWAAGPFLDYFEWVLQQQLEGVHSIPGRHVWLKIIQKRSRCPFWFLPGTLFLGHSYLSLMIIVNDRWSTGQTMMACSMPVNSSPEQLRFFWFRKYHQKRS